MRSGWLGDLIFATSLVNLILLPVWYELLYAPPAQRYFLPQPTPQSLFAVLVNLAILSLLLGAALRLGRRIPSRTFVKLARAALLLVAVDILSFNGLPLFDHVWLPRLYGLFGESFAIAAGAALATVIAAPFLFPGIVAGVTRGLAILLLVLAPFTVINVLWTGWTLAVMAQPLPFVDDAPAPRAGTRLAPRIVWLLFDELDYRVLFEARPKGLALPELDALAGEALVAVRVEEEADVTLRAVPAMFVGRALAEATPVGPSELVIRTGAAETAQSWAESQHLLAGLLEIGWRTALVGWHHPYCRLFRGYYDACTGVFMGSIQIEDNAPFGAAVQAQARSFDPLFRRRNAIGAFRRTLAAAKRYAANPSFDFVFVHVSVPHEPFIFDRARGRFTVVNFSAAGYMDGLALVDRFLGEVRRALEDAELMDETTILVTSDHGWRASDVYIDGRRDNRIPLILRLAGRHRPVRSAEPLPARTVKELLLALARSELSQPDAVADWLSMRR